MKGTQPCTAFVGSADYTLTAFGRGQIESMAETNPQSVMEFYHRVRRDTIDCNDDEIEQTLVLTKAREVEKDGESIILSLLDKKTGETPARSGINWGQRSGRDRDQAYINIPVEIRNLNFFPDRFEQFTVLTDDERSFIMARVQDDGKAIHTTQNNALLGSYLRARMGIEPGEYVTRQHLVEYGRTNITFIKIDEETYLMDFRPNMGPGEDIEE